MNIEVYKEPLCRRYYATPFSSAAIYVIGTVATLLLVPFFLAYNPHTFWIKTDTYLEQPEVTYTKQLILLAEGYTHEGSQPFSAYFSSMANVNNLNHANVREAVVKSHPVDANRDGLIDRLTVNVQLPLGGNEEVASVKMLKFFRVRLKDRAKVEMDALAYVEHAWGLEGSSLQTEGDFHMRQAWPLHVHGGYQYPYASDPLLDLASLTSISQARISSLLSRYSARNITLDYSPRYAIWERASSSAPKGGPAPRLFNLTTTIHIGRSPILYTPPVAEVIQSGWSKYFMMLVVVAFLVNRLSIFVFRYQVVETKVVNPRVYGPGERRIG